MINRVVFFILAFILLSGQVIAITPENLNSLENDTIYYLPGQVSTTASACAASAAAAAASPAAGNSSVPSTVPADFNVANGKEIGQMLVIGVTDEATAISLEKTFQIGGFLFNTGFPFSAANTASIAQAAEVAPLFATDEEGGNVLRIPGNYASAKSMGTETDTQVTAEGTAIGNAMTADGLTVDFAPVADIDNGKNFISQEGRSFGSTPAIVTEKAGAFAQGLESAGITPTFKHFPGDGNTVSNTNNATNLGNTDSGPATTPPLASLEANDLVPYQTLLQGYNGAVMVGNQIVPNLTNGAPASLSAATYNLLRGKYGFSGVAFTDSLQDWMGNIDTTVVQAIEAGADMPLINNPTVAEVKGVVGAVQTAVNSGKITQAQIDSSVNKILSFKANASTGGNNSSSAGSCSCSSTSLTGDTAELQVMNFLVGQGLSPTQAAGVAGNIAAESAYQPERLEGTASGVVTPAETLTPTQLTDKNLGWGIVQWTPPGKMVSTFNPVSDADDLGNQLTFLWNDVAAQVKSDLQSAPDGNVLAAVLAFQGNEDSSAGIYQNTPAPYEGYERPADESASVSDRLDAANKALADYGGGGGAAAPNPAGGTTSATCAGASGATGTVDQGTDVQLAQKLLNYQNTGQYKCDNSGDCTDLEYMAEGKDLTTEPELQAGYHCLVAAVDPRVLQLLLYIIEVGNFKIGTFAICGDHHSDPGAHSSGVAVDIDSVNGVFVNQDTPAAKANTLALDQFLDNSLPASLKLDQQINYGYGNHEDDTLAATQQAQGAICATVQDCVNFYTLAVEQEHENHIHAGYPAPPANAN